VAVLPAAVAAAAVAAAGKGSEPFFCLNRRRRYLSQGKGL